MNIGLKWVKNFFIISNWRTLIRAVGGGGGRGGGGVIRVDSKFATS